MRATILTLLLALAAQAADPNFLSRRDYAVVGSDAVAAGDFNEDGIRDLAGCNRAGRLAFLQGFGDGTFKIVTDQAEATIGCWAMTTRDLNGDGHLDLIQGGNLDGTVTSPSGVAVLYGKGDGTFTAPVIYRAPFETGCREFVLRDFNGDRVPDVAMVGIRGLWFFPGRSGGRFDRPVLTPLFSTAANRPIVAADFDSDGKLDVAAATDEGFGLFFGNGDGTFRLVGTYLRRGTYPGLATGDLNRDGRADLVVVSRSFAPSAEILLGMGDGTFAAGYYVNLPGGERVALGDLNGDDVLDLVSNSPHVAFGKGDGTFDAPIFYVAGPQPKQLLLADLRRSGRLDIVTANDLGTVSVLLNLGRGKYLDPVPITATIAAFSGAVADFNNDGKDDFAGVALGGPIAIHLATGRILTPFVEASPIPLTDASSATAGDLNGDGNNDLLVSTPTHVLTFLGRGDGTFTAGTNMPMPSYPKQPVVADFNRDGRLDAAWTGNYYALGNGDGTFQQPAELVHGVMAPLFGVPLISDFNLDGYPDIAMWENHGRVYILLSRGDGSFSQLFFSEYRVATAAADFNGDGKPDLLMNDSDSRFKVYLGNGDGTFQDGITFEFQFGGCETMAQDFNGDGKADIAKGTSAGSSLAVAVGRGDGTFEDVQYFGIGSCTGVYAGNFRGQPAASGLPDILSTDFSGRMYFLPNITRDAP